MGIDLLCLDGFTISDMLMARNTQDWFRGYQVKPKPDSSLAQVRAGKKEETNMDIPAIIDGILECKEESGMTFQMIADRSNVPKSTVSTSS